MLRASQLARITLQMRKRIADRTRILKNPVGSMLEAVRFTTAFINRVFAKRICLVDGVVSRRGRRGGDRSV